ncbi:hypothetical protein NQZ68_011338 [Dissostichus eleginoides]|nr:hypothetical protein NQZ68_011338 [Dissostichus eleginoides]
MGTHGLCLSQLQVPLVGRQGGENTPTQQRRRFSWLHCITPCSAQSVLTYRKENITKDRKEKSEKRTETSLDTMTVWSFPTNFLDREGQRILNEAASQSVSSLKSCILVFA